MALEASLHEKETEDRKRRRRRREETREREEQERILQQVREKQTKLDTLIESVGRARDLSEDDWNEVRNALSHPGKHHTQSTCSVGPSRNSV